MGRDDGRRNLDWGANPTVNKGRGPSLTYIIPGYLPTSSPTGYTPPLPEKVTVMFKYEEGCILHARHVQGSKAEALPTS